jgi:hypothetical protein
MFPYFMPQYRIAVVTNHLKNSVFLQFLAWSPSIP